MKNLTIEITDLDLDLLIISLGAKMIAYKSVKKEIGASNAIDDLYTKAEKLQMKLINIKYPYSV